MKWRRLVQTLVGLAAVAVVMAGTSVGAASGEDVNRMAVAANIPLDSYVYTYLHKLEGLGYLETWLPDTKPYTRTQAASWLRPLIEEEATDAWPEYARSMLQQLESEFGPELAALREETAGGEFGLREVKWRGAYDDGPTLVQKTRSHYQPLNINHNGERLTEGFNNSFRLQLEGRFQDTWVLVADPQLTWKVEENCSAKLAQGYLKTRIGNLGIQWGKDEMWWGPGQRGNLSLTNNAAPLNALQLSNLEPLRPKGLFGFLKQVDGTFFYAELNDERTVKEPSFIGFRATVTPADNFSLSATLNSIVGGEGRHLKGRDYWEFITGKNAVTAEADKWNSIAGFDLRWSVPQLKGLQLYGEYYGEDQAGKTIPLPSQNTYLVGMFVPRLTDDGKWDLALEKGQTTRSWYVHWVYKEGWVYQDQLLGDAMGTNAERTYAKVARYFRDGALLAFNAETLTMDADTSNPQRVHSFWLAYSKGLQPGLTLAATLGVAEVENGHYQNGQSDHCLLLSLELNKRF